MITFAPVVFGPKLYLIGAIGLLLMACGDAPSNSQIGNFDLHRLDGRWEYMDNQTFQIEEWNAQGEKDLIGIGFVLDGQDTTFIEFLSIREDDGALTYFARPSDSNSAEIVPFRLESEASDELVFANPANDYPKKIGYRIHSDSTMQVFIEGPREGKTTRKVFDFIKQKAV